MNNDFYENINDQDPIVNDALEKIRRDRRCQRLYEANRIGPTGPTGPTGRLFKSSNRIIIDSS